MKTILVVDDEPEIVSVFQLMLEEAGYDVATAQTGAAAIAWMKEGPGAPDLVLADMMMPGMTGAEMIEALRAEGHTGFPAVLITAWPRAATRAQTQLFAEILQKPVRSTRLLDIVAKLIGPP